MDTKPVTSRNNRGRALQALRQAAAACTACDLYRRATQTVFGEGSPRAAIVLVGEQPGHEEDLAGRPFVGPAGRLLDEALARAGLDRRRLYVTNAVKHFKWKPAEGEKRRIHERPRQGEIEACRPWFQQELWLIQPDVLVCLGATAARAAVGRAFTIAAARSRVLVSSFGNPTLVTVHPSAILRARDSRDRQTMMRQFVADLRQAARVAGKAARSSAPGRAAALIARSRLVDSASDVPPRSELAVAAPPSARSGRSRRASPRDRARGLTR